ncbi:MAG: zeta toxin family protein [Nostocaceae cyanobacterium]|nr:zeta toxin family protein [Nostocaceae cyanobacterium]
MTSRPILIIVAGANGSGKSTFTRASQEALQVPVIDPDREARQIRPDAPSSAAIEGGKQAIRLARTYIENDESFAVETTLAGNTYLRMMAEVKQKGWLTTLIYVGIENVQISINRVAQRVSQGGHNVPEEDIRRRYTRSLANLLMALQLADRTIIFDNSTTLGHQQLLVIENGRMTQLVRELPNWLYTLLPQELLSDNQS